MNASDRSQLLRQTVIDRNVIPVKRNGCVCLVSVGQTIPEREILDDCILNCFNISRELGGNPTIEDCRACCTDCLQSLDNPENCRESCVLGKGGPITPIAPGLTPFLNRARDLLIQFTIFPPSPAISRQIAGELLLRITTNYSFPPKGFDSNSTDNFIRALYQPFDQFMSVGETLRIGFNHANVISATNNNIETIIDILIIERLSSSLRYTLYQCVDTFGNPSNTRAISTITDFSNLFPASQLVVYRQVNGNIELIAASDFVLSELVNFGTVEPTPPTILCTFGNQPTPVTRVIDI